MKPLEAAVAHLDSISSAWALDLNILKAGLADAAKRIEALELNPPKYGNMLVQAPQAAVNHDSPD